ncbi:accessory gene regulator B [[Clostridium] propionicum DSM 1682]|uniref:Accessory gene regulator B n=2 Tax=Anaerotignum propionicum TaxID=28446 RepID=A0A0X1U787_ANAPI|nr:accessory protein regulator protein B [Anaerotignum propionicum DSM 1682]SHE73887.1 accessory gene regulator B [[Clostridium] propionicum DSM 1682] [Anaerotignum propionicum DSM 1682]
MQLSKGLQEDDKDIYLFGVYQGAILLLNICTALLIGVALNMLLEIVIYLICFLPLRIFAGGYHAKTQLRCYIMSSFTTVIILLGIQFLQQQESIWEFLSYIVSFGIIWRFAPVADANKPLLEKEHVIYQKKVRKVLLLLTGIAALTYFLGFNIISTVIEVSVCFLSVILLMGIYKNKVHCNNIEELECNK